MIATLLRLGWLNLRRDRVALGLTFVLPIAFFSLFAIVFGGMSGGGTRKVPVALADDDRSPASARIVAALVAEPGLKVSTTASAEDPTPLDRAAAEALVRNGDVSAAIVLPKALAGDLDERPAIVVLYDAADPVASNLVAGLLQRNLYTAMPDLLIEQGIGQLERYAGPLTPVQKTALDRWLPELRSASSEGTADGAQIGGLFAVETQSVMTDDAGEAKNATIAFYAAGTGVMFLLFSMTGTAGSMLDEQDSGTLERLLAGARGMDSVLLGKWLWAALVGFVQVSLMFGWGALVFGLDLFGKDHFLGFVVMTIFTAAAAASFGMVLATACRSRAQLSGVSTITILLMSAVGGSMFPRFLMPETMRSFGLVTFNAWALDGYQKVFWYDTGVASLWPQLLVLAAIAAVLFGIARRFARRWDVA